MMTARIPTETHPDADLRLDLLLGLLDEEASSQVLAHLDACPACEEAFRRQYADQQHLLATRELRTTDSGQLEVMRRKASSSAKPRLRLIHRRPMMRVAIPLLAAAAVLFLLWFWPGEGPEAEGSRWLPVPAKGLLIRQGAPTGDSADLTAGLDAYARKDLAAAIDLLSRARSEGTLDLVRRVYLGSALLQASRPAEAADMLVTVTSQPLPDPWGSESRWNLYLALAGSGLRVEAATLLGDLAREEGELGRRARAEEARLERSGR